MRKLDASSLLAADRINARRALERTQHGAAVLLSLSRAHLGESSEGLCAAASSAMGGCCFTGCDQYATAATFDDSMVEHHLCREHLDDTTVGGW